MTIPKKGKKGKEKKQKYSDIDFSKLARKLKALVSFTVDLRKTDANPNIEKGQTTFSLGTKKALLDADREIREMGKTATFVPIKREKGESKSAYKRRLSQTRKETGQRGSHLAGVYIDTPNFASIKAKRIKREGKWTTEITTSSLGQKVPLTVGYGREITEEKFIPINREEFDADPEAYMIALQDKYMKKETDTEEEKKDKWDYINPMHSAWRGEGAQLGDRFFTGLIRKMIKWAYKYNNFELIDENEIEQAISKKEHWITGFVLGRYITIPNKGAMI